MRIFKAKEDVKRLPEPELKRIPSHETGVAKREKRKTKKVLVNA
jgi:hypothetical protein